MEKKPELSEYYQTKLSDFWTLTDKQKETTNNLKEVKETLIEMDEGNYEIGRTADIVKYVKIFTKKHYKSYSRPLKDVEAEETAVSEEEVSDENLFSEGEAVEVEE